MIDRDRLATARRRRQDHPRWRWMALVVVAGGMMLSVLNVSIANIALPYIAADLGTDVAGVGWVVTGFLVAQATLLPVAGRAGDLYGRRRVLVMGVLVLGGASVLCALAWSVTSLVFFRVLQGVGASAMAPTAFAYAAELFDARERGTALGVMGGVLALAPVVSLNLGGALVEVAGWRAVFLFTPLAATVVLVAIALVLPESRPSSSRRRFDLPGAALAAAGLFALLLALSRGGAWGADSLRTVGLVVLGAVALAAFVVRERSVDDPMIDLGLTRLRSFRTSNLAAMGSSAALFGTLVLLPFQLTAVLGFGPAALGLGISPIALSFVVVAPLTGRVIDRVGANRLAAAGLALASGGCLAAAAAAPSASYALLAPGIVTLGVGLAMASAPITSVAIDGVPRARLGVAAAIPNISRYTGGALGTALMSAILAASLPAGRAVTGARLAPPDRAPVAQGFREAMLAGAAFLVLAAVAAARMPRPVGAPRGPLGATPATSGPAP